MADWSVLGSPGAGWVGTWRGKDGMRQVGARSAVLLVGPVVWIEILSFSLVAEGFTAGWMVGGATSAAASVASVMIGTTDATGRARSALSKPTGRATLSGT